MKGGNEQKGKSDAMHRRMNISRGKHENMKTCHGLQTIRITVNKNIKASVLNFPCFVLSTFYATKTQGIVLKMFLNILINKVIIKKKCMSKNQPNNTAKRFFSEVGYEIF